MSEMTMMVEAGATVYHPMVSSSVMDSGVPHHWVSKVTALFTDEKTGDIVGRSQYGHIHSVRPSEVYATEQEAYAAVVRQMRSMATKILDAANKIEGEKVRG